MPTTETGFIAKIREQIAFLQNEEYNYDELRVYVSGIAEPWVFGPADDFPFDGDEVLVVRDGPAEEYENEGMPEYVFPLRHVVATELAVSEGSRSPGQRSRY
jgi:hypothetical protein